MNQVFIKWMSLFFICINFTLLSDEDNRVRKLFGIPTNLLGLLRGRVTYVVNKKG